MDVLEKKVEITADDEELNDVRKDELKQKGEKHEHHN